MGGEVLDTTTTTIRFHCYHLLLFSELHFELKTCQVDRLLNNLLQIKVDSIRLNGLDHILYFVDGNQDYFIEISRV